MPRELQAHVQHASGRESNATIFAGWEFYAPVAGAKSCLTDLLAHQVTAPVRFEFIGIS